MKPKSTVDTLLRYWPVLLSLIGLVGFCYTLNIRVANAEDKNKTQDDWLIKQSSSNQDMKISQAKTEEQTKQIYALLQEMRSDLKSSSRGR